MALHDVTFARARGRFVARVDGPDPAPVMQGGADTVLCLHGFPDHAPTFDDLLPRLASAGFSAVAPWLRGHRPSTLAGPFDLDTLADDVIDLAAAVAGDRPVHLVGHDWGAAIAATAAARHPRRVAKVVMLSVPHPMAFLEHLALHPGQMAKSWYMGFFQLPGVPERAVARGLVRRLWRDWSPGWSAPEPLLAAAEACVQESLPGPLESYRAMTRPMGAALRRVRSGRSAARAVTAPTLLLQGEADGCIDAASGLRAQDFHRGAWVRETLPGIGHFPHLEAPSVVTARIVDWLRGR